MSVCRRGRSTTMDGTAPVSSGSKKTFNLRLAVILSCLTVFVLLLAAVLFFSAKVHLHVPVESKDGKTKFFNVLHNYNAVELFTLAQEHDRAGAKLEATEDYKATITSATFKSLPEKFKPTLMELADCRDMMDDKDYFDEMIAHSRICFWTQEQMPLKIYVPDESHADGFSPFDQNEIERCFREWCEIIPGRISFKFVNSPGNADIVFSQKQSLLDLSYSRTVLAHTIPIPSGPEKWSVFPASKCTIEPLRFQPEIKDYSDRRAELRHTVFLHEIGHSLGLIGHSCNAGDLMFFSGAPEISSRDKATLKRIYEPGSIHERAEKSLRKMAAKNDKYALIQLAIQLDENGTASPEKLREIFQLAKRAADLGSNRALLMLGWMYHDGNGVKRNLPEAVKCFHAAAAQGNPAALLALSSAYERGDGEPQNIPAAEKYLRLALRMDLARAPIAYGNFLSYQFGDQGSLEKAAAFYQRSGSKDQTEALLRLALLYEHGEGVKKDLQESKQLRRKASDQLQRLKAKDAVEYFARGCAWSEIGESEKAIDDLSKAIELKPDFRAGYLARGAAEQACGKNVDACKDMGKAIELDPDCVQGYLGRAYSYLGLGKAEDALVDVKSLLALTADPDSDRLYGLIVGSIAYRMLNDENGSRKLLDEAAAMTGDKYWPGPIVRFLRHDLSEADFAKEALGYSRATEVKFYLAMDQSLSGNVEDAISNLQWVKENGDKSFYEYPVALAQLDRLQQKTQLSARNR